MISERTREKMVAARRRGKWTGGIPPLGYDTSGGKLVPNPDEAIRAQGIFDLVLKHEALMGTLTEMAERNWTTKSWTTKRGQYRRGKPFQKASLRRLLTNPVYIGKVLHQGRFYDGEHEAIIDLDVWERVQAILKRNGSNGGKDVRNRHGALLKGILRCGPCDAAMVHTFAKKKGRLYRYYVCTNAQKRGWASCPTKSVPAEEIERYIYERVRAIGRDPELVEKTISSTRMQIAEQVTHLEADIRMIEGQARRLDKEKLELLQSAGRGGALGSIAAVRLELVEKELQSTTLQVSSLRRQLSDLREQKIDPDDLTSAIRHFDPIWDVLLPPERTRIVRLLIEHVDFDGGSGTMGITFRPSGVKVLLTEAETPEEVASVR